MPAATGATGSPRAVRSTATAENGTGGLGATVSPRSGTVSGPGTRGIGPDGEASGAPPRTIDRVETRAAPGATVTDRRVTGTDPGIRESALSRKASTRGVTGIGLGIGERGPGRGASTRGVTGIGLGIGESALGERTNDPGTRGIGRATEASEPRSATIAGDVTEGALRETATDHATTATDPVGMEDVLGETVTVLVGTAIGRRATRAVPRGTATGRRATRATLRGTATDPVTRGTGHHMVSGPATRAIALVGTVAGRRVTTIDPGTRGTAPGVTVTDRTDPATGATGAVRTVGRGTGRTRAVRPARLRTCARTGPSHRRSPRTSCRPCSTGRPGRRCAR